ncbi:MAG: hypothetical protein V3T72_18300 [Thermoanaerobaculia bacterium]
MPATVDSILKDIAADKTSPVYLVTGDVVLAEPPAKRLAQALAEKSGCEIETHRRPARFGDILQDLCTYSLFGSGKVALVTDTAVLADERAAAELIDQAAAALPVENPGVELEGDQRAGASRLLLALHLFGFDVYQGTAAEVLEALPKWALQGGGPYRRKRPRGRPAKEAAKLEEGLVDLLEGARQSGLQGFAEGDLAELGEVVRKGLPPGHHLVLVEHSVATAHPVVKTLKSHDAFADAGKVTSVKGEWLGLEALTAELARETSAEIARDAAVELARRTLRQSGEWKNKQVDAESTARFAAEYRKLASLSGGAEITRQQVAEAVEDRGEEDVWKILDALGNGRGGDALMRYRRLMASADDTIGARLGFFGLLAGFCRQISAIAGVARIRKVPAGVQNYQQFQSRWAAKLKDDLPDADNPLSGLHPYRLHRAYLAASAFDRGEIAKLPWRVLETEMRIKGESSEPDVAISQLMIHVAASIGKASSRGGSKKPAQRKR